jgi:hypothetical protein
LGEKVGALVDGRAESQDDLIEGMVGVGVGGGEGIESGVRGEGGRKGDWGGDFLEWSVGVMDA